MPAQRTASKTVRFFVLQSVSAFSCFPAIRKDKRASNFERRFAENRRRSFFDSARTPVFIASIQIKLNFCASHRLRCAPRLTTLIH
jgi:hypothetical protein